MFFNRANEVSKKYTSVAVAHGGIESKHSGLSLGDMSPIAISSPAQIRHSPVQISHYAEKEEEEFDSESSEDTASSISSEIRKEMETASPSEIDSPLTPPKVLSSESEEESEDEIEEDSWLEDPILMAQSGIDLFRELDKERDKKKANRTLDEIKADLEEKDIEPQNIIFEPDFFSLNKANVQIGVNLYINDICIKNGGIRNFNRDQKIYPGFYRPVEKVVPVDLFLQELASKSRSSVQALICMLILLDRYCDPKNEVDDPKDKRKDINYSNIHFLSAVALMIINKNFSDFKFKLYNYAEYLGLVENGYEGRKKSNTLTQKDRDGIKELVEMEQDFFEKIDHKTFITNDQFSEKYNQVATNLEEFNPEIYQEQSTGFYVANLDELGGIPIPRRLS